MAITQQDYFLRPGETQEQYHARIAALRAAEVAPIAPISTDTPGKAYGSVQEALSALDPITGELLAPTPSLPSTPVDVESPLPIIVPQPQLTEPEKQENDISKQLQGLEDIIAGKPAFQIEQEATQGIAAKTITQKSIYNQLLNLKAFTENIPAQLQAESVGRGRTVGGIEPIEAGRLRLAGIQATILNANYQAATGDLATAEALVERAVKNKYAPEEAKRTALLNKLKLIQDSPEYSIADKNRAAKQEQKQKEREAQIEQAKEYTKAILALGNKVASSKNQDANSASIIRQINALMEGDVTIDDLTQAEQFASPYLVEKEKAPSLGGEFERYQFFAEQRGEPITQEGFLKFRADEGAAGREPAGEETTPEAIDAWARRISAGTDKISSVPTNIRNSVVAKSKEFAQEDLQEDIQEGLNRNLKKEDLTKQLQTAYPEFSKTEIEKLVTNSTPTKAEEETKKGFFGKVGSFFGSLFR